ncbi:histidine phosphatase family protein [Salipaludibacillus keqinensis]|uniref:Histidine phosphatase family protein n=1 Tax=Salipaludibacillus keqinensis TaxID=2045207 RepID=A0A323TJV9_9BACI|nr:histidine phosphatase family protein [Salipaludibacillus keqinensis]PYZ95281.1 histidine phosphatase family protein [Salipaludibacillus keqinensis]
MNRSLLSSLREGGLIFYARHGEATVGMDLPSFHYQNCLAQRNLSEEGRRQAIYYGKILRALQIPIQSPVSTSPFCRTIETAQLAFGSGNVIVDPFLADLYRLSGDLSSRDRQRILDNLQAMLEKNPEGGGNKVIVAHSFPVGVGLGQIPDMGTVIVRPKGEGHGYEVISQLSLEDFSILCS